jgi:hypothetical protein
MLIEAAKKAERKKEKREANQMIGEPRRAVQSGWQSGPGRGARHHVPAMQQDGQWAMPLLHFMHALAYQPRPTPPPPPMYHPPPISRGNVFQNGHGAQGGVDYQPPPPTPASGHNAM